MRVPNQFVLLLTLLFALPMSALAQTYKCKQPDGKIAFQDQPCQGTSTGSQITVRATPPSSDPAELKKLKAATSANKELASQNKAAADDFKAQTQQVDAHNKSVRCDAARRSLGVLKSQRPVFRYDNNGDKQYVDDTRRQAEMATAQSGVSENCN